MGLFKSLLNQKKKKNCNNPVKHPVCSSSKAYQYYQVAVIIIQKLPQHTHIVIEELKNIFIAVGTNHRLSIIIKFIKQYFTISQMAPHHLILSCTRNPSSGLLHQIIPINFRSINLSHLLQQCQHRKCCIPSKPHLTNMHTFNRQYDKKKHKRKLVNRKRSHLCKRVDISSSVTKPLLFTFLFSTIFFEFLKFSSQNPNFSFLQNKN